MKCLIDSDKSGSISINKFTGSNLGALASIAGETERSPDDFCVLFLDVETTGLSQDTDKIIQLALRPVFINRNSHEISKCAGLKVMYNDPGMKITSEITQLTGVTDDDVDGKHIDWKWLNNIIERVDLVVCHNARFDRGFVMRHLQDADISEPSTIWACSLRQVDWKSVCRASNALEVLCVWHGFYYEAHDAGNDVNALIYLLSVSGRMGELLANAQKSEWRVFAVDLPFDDKDDVKARNYRWDPEVKMWYLTMSDEESAKTEAQFLNESYAIEPQIFEIEPRYLFA